NAVAAVGATIRGCGLLLWAIDTDAEATGKRVIVADIAAEGQHQQSIGSRSAVGVDKAVDYGITVQIGCVPLLIVVEEPVRRVVRDVGLIVVARGGIASPTAHRQP